MTETIRESHLSMEKASSAPTSNRFIRRRRNKVQSAFFHPSSYLFFVLVLCWLNGCSRYPTAGRSTCEESPCRFCPFLFVAASSSVQESNEENNGWVRRNPDQAVVLSQQRRSLNQILITAGRRGLGGGIPGAIAGMIQVASLMWLRTISNYQYRYGTTFLQAFKTLMREGGIARLYRGFFFALIQAPLARFVSTAANDGVDSLMASLSYTQNWGPGRKTFVASIFVGFWRMILMREFKTIDTMKTVLQVDSVEGFRSLIRRLRNGRIDVLFQGATATCVSAILGHYPWFYTYHLLNDSQWLQAVIPRPFLRNAGIGLIASIVSDTVVNFMRVIKTTKQSLGSKHGVTYSEVIEIILATDGWRGLFGRGLRTRIFANALQSILFTVIWRGLADYMKREPEEESQD
ncbi:hypothetical protein FisN_6Hh384 [Fistulifera solaris]|uniref:Uncharacterized protein n=1 Tax=Fistulifera solaris TaxID=1519565 RepID=A0A1Z5K7B2_FISSO|nr:hypothetical protein FisN_6Hh384 [Fistulifera solaris]|eukprot:GAX22134.1 hypothetical protein FisN_6Hh384 [Fistulifera solaris]